MVIHDAELRLAAGHTGVGFGNIFERKFLNHRTYAGKGGEAHGVFESLGVPAAQPWTRLRPKMSAAPGISMGAMSAPATSIEPLRTESVKHFRHGLGAWRCGQNDSCAAEFCSS